jgi:hypothetical protein
LGWDRAEACYFRDAAIKCGVPPEAILTEEASTNTGDNVRLSRAILEAKGLPHDTIVVVQKPFMERRAFATFKKVWPEPVIAVTSVDASWHDYVKGALCTCTCTCTCVGVCVCGCVCVCVFAFVCASGRWPDVKRHCVV